MLATHATRERTVRTRDVNSKCNGKRTKFAFSEGTGGLYMFRTRTAMTFAAVAAMFLGAAVTAPALHAQSATPRHERGGRGDELRGINLTPVQKVQVDSIRQQYKTSNDAMRTQYEALRTAQTSNDTAAMRAAQAKIQANKKTWRAQRVAQQKAIEAVLTPDQKTQLQKNRATRVAHRKRAVTQQGQTAGQAAPASSTPTQ